MHQGYDLQLTRYDSPPSIFARCIGNLLPVFPCRCFGLMPSSAIFVSAASHNSVHSRLP